MDATGSGGRQRGHHIRRTATMIYFHKDKLSAHSQWSLARLNNSTARAAENTLSLQSNRPLDHKVADICVSSARTSTIFSTITKLIKS